MLFIRSLSSIMSVGRSFETAVVMAIHEIKKENTTNVLLDDFNEMLILIEANTNHSEIFDVFADKYSIESMINFSKIIKLVLKQGSSIHRVIENTVLMIEEKTEVEKELEVLIAQKKYELIILLSFVPLIIFYLNSVSSSFPLTMYGTIIGKIVMGVCLCIYIISAIVGKKIVDIEV
jgi:tight adherence protein B